MTKIINLHQFSPQPDDIVVLVTGIFDILHSEHKNLLTQAKQQGSLLLVGLESDNRAQQLKGKNRPINSLKTRLKNLADLNIADYVFSLPKRFTSSQDHQALIKTLRPHILAVSSHTPNLAAKKAILKKFNIQLKVVLKHNPKISTTKTINQQLP